MTFQLVAGPFSFNGFTTAGGRLTVPPRSNNVINFEQGDGTPHSAEVASGTGPVPNSGGDPAIPRAYTNKVVEGLPRERGRHTLHGAGQRHLPHHLRRPGTRAVGHVALVQGGSGGEGAGFAHAK